MFNTGRLSELDKQRKYVIELYKDGAPCYQCGKIQTPWEALKITAEEWHANETRMYHCVECDARLRQDVYLIGGWGWGNPDLKVHR